MLRPGALSARWAPLAGAASRPVDTPSARFSILSAGSGILIDELALLEHEAPPSLPQGGASLYPGRGAPRSGSSCPKARCERVRLVS